MKVSHIHEDWKDIICCGVENQQIDFKSAQDWNELSRAGRAKFARHAMALANTQGGYVVVGVSEDSNGNPIVYQGLTEKQAASFDPSTVGQTINRYADPAVSFDIVRPVVDGKTYVVFVVYPFKDLPHVCGDACENELQRGVFYVRSPDARSRAAYRASELQALISRSLRNQRSQLGRMLRGILYEDRQSAEPSAGDVFQTFIERARTYAKEQIGTGKFHKWPIFELIAYPTQQLSDLSLTDVRTSFENLEIPGSSGFPLPNAQLTHDLFATNDSIRGWQHYPDGTPVAAWDFSRNGLLYGAAVLQKTDSIQAETILKLTLVAFTFVGQLFSKLNRSSDIITIIIRICNTLELALHVSDSDSDTQQICKIPDIEVRKQRSPGDLEAGGTIGVALKTFIELCERFNVSFDNSDKARLHEELTRFLEHGLIG